MKYFVVIPAAGVGNRMNRDCPKQYVPLCGKTIIEHSISVFLDHPLIEKIMVCLSEEDQYFKELTIAQHEKIKTTLGGKTRAESVFRGLQQLNIDPQDWVLVHDAARPLLSKKDLDHLITTLKDHTIGGLLGAPLTSSIKYVENFQVKKNVMRENLWEAFTPQMFRYELLYNALENNFYSTDCSSAVSLRGHQPLMVQGDPLNLKITFPNDLKIAEIFLKSRHSQE